MQAAHNVSLESNEKGEHFLGVTPIRISLHEPSKLEVTLFTLFHYLLMPYAWNTPLLCPI